MYLDTNHVKIAYYLPRFRMPSGHPLWKSRRKQAAMPMPRYICNLCVSTNKGKIYAYIKSCNERKCAISMIKERRRPNRISQTVHHLTQRQPIRQFSHATIPLINNLAIKRILVANKPRKWLLSNTHTLLPRAAVDAEVRCAFV